MKKSYLLIIPLLILTVFTVNSCFLEDLFGECRHYTSFLEEPTTTTVLEIECNCEQELFLSQQLLPYTNVEELQFHCENEAEFDEIPIMDSVKILNSYVITENISVAFPNLERFNSYQYRSISNTIFLINLPELKHLELSNVIDLPSELNSLSLETFSLFINDTVALIPTNLNDFDNLTDLEIKTINTTIPTDLTNLSSLNSLKVEGNDLNLAELIGFPNLKVLDLKAEMIIVPQNHIFENLDSLEELHLSGNFSIADQLKIFKAPNLKILTLINNFNSFELSDSIGKLQGLETLSLTGSSIPSTIGTLTNLQHLRCQDLTTFPTSILPLANFANLELLSIQNGNFSTVPPEIGNFTSVKELYLTWNGLTTLPSEIQNLSPTLEFLNLIGNEFSDSSRQEIINWLPNTVILF